MKQADTRPTAQHLDLHLLSHPKQEQAHDADMVRLFTKGSVPFALFFLALWLAPGLTFFTGDAALGNQPAVLFGLPGGFALAVGWCNFEKLATTKRCAGCGRKMIKLGEGSGCVMVLMEERASGVGTAEECWECGRIYCDGCWPGRSRNSCDCGRGHDAVRSIRGVIYRGSLRLVKVRYLDE
jgi:hypothetical protein